MVKALLGATQFKLVKVFSIILSINLKLLVFYGECNLSVDVADLVSFDFSRIYMPGFMRNRQKALTMEKSLS